MEPYVLRASDAKRLKLRFKTEHWYKGENSYAFLYLNVETLSSPVFSIGFQLKSNTRHVALPAGIVYDTPSKD